MDTGNSRVRSVLVLLSILAALSAIGLIGYQQLQPGSRDNQLRRGVLSRGRNDGETIQKSLMENIRGDNILNFLRQLTKKPHRAGTEENDRVAQLISDQWKAQGLDDVHFAEYDVLLSHPADYASPNTIDLLDSKGALIYQSIGQSPPLIPEEQSDFGANFTFNAYSASGTVTANLVYVNYGTPDDFDYLESRNVSLNGKIAILRYGHVWRGAKANQAQRRGAVGVVLYSDPADVCPNITDDQGKYPNSVWMPKGGVQLGSLLNADGDPLTPLYPSVDYVYRSKNISDLMGEEIIPSIPVQPISYADAYEFLSRMTGQTAPGSWQGGLNLTYKVDQGSESDWKVRLTVKADTARRKIRNVIGFVKGRKEPDRYVIMGNHFDAWIYGAVDPNSGTAVMLEISRAFMQLINETGWRPLRTVVFCAWDAEEYGLIGSTEWVEQHATALDRRAVAYLNLDCITGNDTLLVMATPSLYGAAAAAAKRVPNPNPEERAAGRKTLFDTWIRRMPPSELPGVPTMPEPPGGSDQVAFFEYLGIPVARIDYSNMTESYPLYHTLYETPFLQERLMDTQNFSVHVATGQFWAEMARNLADSAFLPLNVDHYTVMIQSYVSKLNETLIEAKILPGVKEVEQDVQSLANALERMLRTAEKFHYNAKEGREENKQAYALKMDMINSRLQQFERCFINPRGLPGYPAKRHVVLSTENDDMYASNVLPFVYPQIGNYVRAKSEEERTNAVNELRQQISILHYSVECVISLLKEVPSTRL